MSINVMRCIVLFLLISYYGNCFSERVINWIRKTNGEKKNYDEIYRSLH